MLLQLNIKNFALIEDLSISFDKGFNVLSGETGAGKSILIDAINYVTGCKFNKELIRTGENKTYVEAVFTIENVKTKEILNEMDIENDDMIVISRETFQSGKSIAKINGKSVLITNLKSVSDTLIDIYGQHESINLLNSDNHSSYLDSYGGKEIGSILNEYQVCYNKFKETERKILMLEGQDGEREKQIDFLKYQIDEINNAHLKTGEEEELESKCSVLSNAEKINLVLSSAYTKLYSGEENSISIEDNLGSIVKDLRTIEKHIEKIKNTADSIEECYYTIEECIENIRNIKDTVYYDENELESVNNRIYSIGLLKKKYGRSIDEILKYKESIEKKYNDYINHAEIIENLKNEKNNILCKLNKYSEILHNKRVKYSNILEKLVEEELKYIGMEKSSFKILCEKNDTFTMNGNDKISFMISTNPGEPLKPLEKIISGGELSRIMLALKTVFADKDKIPTIIFDEIDTGISGKIAQSVGEKMYQVSLTHQVFCVTHLPQIACMSDNHYVVEKSVVKDKTYTHVLNADMAEKASEIARMIGGAEVTKLTLEHSKEMIRMADAKKDILRQK